MKLSLGGIAVLVGVVLLSRALGVDLTGLVGGGGAGSGTPPQPDPKARGSGPDPDAELVEFIRDVMKDIQDTFETKFKDTGWDYRRAKLYIFTELIDTKCGRSSSAIGPFYCPGDENAYIDLSFYRDLRERFKAPGDFAQAYVLAHEIGHHAQNLRDADAEVKRKQPNENRNKHSVRIELQADCYAGVWGHSAKQRGKLDMDDYDEALNAAAAIGDDRLQQQSGRDVKPESFTHGTSEQRKKWFRRGYESGRLDACDTFSGEP